MNLPFQFFRMKRSMTKPARKLVGVLSFLLACFVAVLPASAQTPRKVIIGVSNPDNVTFFPLYYAKEAGYFREQGLEPQLIVMNSDLAVKALVTGDVDYAASTASVAKAAALGFPVKIIVSFFNGTDFSLVSKPEIKVPGDLKNKIVAVSRFGSAADFDARGANASGSRSGEGCENHRGGRGSESPYLAPNGESGCIRRQCRREHSCPGAGDAGADFDGEVQPPNTYGSRHRDK